MWETLIPAAVNLFGGISSGNAARKAQNAANQAYIQSSQLLASLTPPNLASLLQPYQQAVFLGEMTPEEYVAVVQEQSQLNNIAVDPQLVSQQYETLRQMNEIATEGGITAIDRAQLNDIANQEAAKARGAREAATQEYAARGIGGSGMEVLRRELADQSAVQAASQRGTDVAAAAQQRALQAMTQSGQLAGQLRTQEYGEKSAAASAQDAINRFNAQMAQQASSGNVDARNQAASDALAQRYNLQQYNIEQQNRQNEARINAAQQDWANQFGQTSAVAGRQADLGAQFGKQAASQGAASSAAWGKVGEALPGIIREWKKPSGGTTTSDRNLKHDIEQLTPEQISSVLDQLTGYKYKYNNPKDGEGVQIGPMAQDLQKTDASGMVVETPDGLAIDKDKALRFALSALSTVGQRVSKLEGNK